MKNTYGQSIAVTIFGESHGAEIGAVIDGLAPGIEVSEEYIASRLDLRRPSGKISTKRVEKDPFRIVSGVFEGKTTGTPVTILIPNENTKSKDYSLTRQLARPGHADYTAFLKYHGFEDYRGGGHFSGRITAAIVAAGAIIEYALAKKGIRIGTHVKACAGITDRDFANTEEEMIKDIEYLHDIAFPVLDKEAADSIYSAMEAAAADGDSVGGVLESVVVGFPGGVGEPWFDSLESQLAHVLFAVPAIKGVQFGKGFEFAGLRGSEANDPLRMSDGKIVTTTNNNGGINGGISNGMPISFSCAVKPTPSIYKEQDTVNFMKNEDSKLQIQGRHDPAIIHRARIVVDSVTAIALADALAMRFGTDYLA